MERERDLTGAVLIVEDNYALRTTLASVLEETYPVVTASTGATALRLLHGTTRPALILLDLMLPIMSGWEVLTQLHDHPQLAAIPVIVPDRAIKNLPYICRLDGRSSQPVILHGPTF